MFSKLSLFTLFLALASLFIMSSAVPLAEVRVEERGCGRWACMDVLTGLASELPIETSASVSPTVAEPSPAETTVSSTSTIEPAATSAPVSPTVAETSSAETTVSSTSTVEPTAVLSSAQSNGAVFSANAPAFSCFVTLAATATVFTFLL